MKITILANNDLASNYAINMLLPLLANNEVSLFLSSEVGNNKGKLGQLLYLQAFEQNILNQIPLLLDNEGEDSAKFRTFKEMAKQLYSPVSILNNINTAEGINKLKQTKPDLIICIRYGLILKNAAISIPCFGVINLHSGLLPRYRGVMATFWAMLNGDTTIGCTLHYIDNHQIDTGRTIASTKLSVYKKRSYLWHVFTLYEKGILEIAKTVQNIKAEQVITCKAQREGGHYYTFPKADDFQNFVNKGFMLASEAEILALFKTRH